MLPTEPPPKTRLWIKLATLETYATREMGASAPLPPAAPRQLASALDEARNAALLAPDVIRNVSSREKGEFEADEWWERHHQLFKAARVQWGRKHHKLYAFRKHMETFVDKELLAAVFELEENASHDSSSTVDEGRIARLIKPTASPNVHRIRLLTPEFCSALLEELEHAEQSGVPLRRPNGMNRFGAILEELPGGLGMDEMVRSIAHRFVRPIAQMLFPWLITTADVTDHYGFVVKYNIGDDVSLAQHADASVATLNVALRSDFTGGDLTFCGTRFVDKDPKSMGKKSVPMHELVPGEAIVHLGGTYHAAEPITSGQRANMIIWMFGEHGQVRVAPYAESEQLRARQRWKQTWDNKNEDCPSDSDNFLRDNPMSNL